MQVRRHPHVIEEKLNAATGAWNYRKWSDGFWEGWATKNYGTVNMQASNPTTRAIRWNTTAIAIPALPAGVTVQAITGMLAGGSAELFVSHIIGTTVRLRVDKQIPDAVQDVSVTNVTIMYQIRGTWS